METAQFIQESPGLKPEWFDEINSFSIKTLNISLKVK